MAYLRFLGLRGSQDVEWFRLRCECGFQTNAAAVGLASRTVHEHDAWLVAWFDRDSRVLHSDAFTIPLDDVLRGAARRWRDDTVAPHLRITYGSCFVSVPSDATGTDIQCPECQVHKLIQERSEPTAPPNLPGPRDGPQAEPV